jgi:hypothetical protein
MLFNRNTSEKPALQRQLDADAARWRWSRELQHQTDAAFEPDEISTFRMTGLYGQIPAADQGPVRLRPAS